MPMKLDYCKLKGSNNYYDITTLVSNILCVTYFLTSAIVREPRVCDIGQCACMDRSVSGSGLDESLTCGLKWNSFHCTITRDWLDSQTKKLTVSQFADSQHGCRLCCRAWCLGRLVPVWLSQCIARCDVPRCFHGGSVTPSVRFPSVLSRPDGSFNAGISAFAIARHTRSFRLRCLAPSARQTMQSSCVNGRSARALMRLTYVGYYYYCYYYYYRL